MRNDYIMSKATVTRETGLTVYRHISPDTTN